MSLILKESSSEHSGQGNARATASTSEPSPPQGRAGAPKGNKNRRTHGLHTLNAALKDADLRAISKRTTLGRELARRREQIYADAGGRETLSELKVDLI